MKQYLECYVCHSTKEQRLLPLLHNIRLRGEYHKLCTSCVLKHHTGSFCPHCFDIYDPPPSPTDDSVTCLKCDSLSHLACVSNNDDVVTHYLCPSCLNPASYVYLDVGGGGGGLNNKNTNTNTISSSSSSTQDGDGEKIIIDIKLSKILLTAAQLASVSMKKGATLERFEAEKKVKHACVMRKRAREALQEVHSTALRLKGNGNESRRMMMMIQGIPSPVAIAVEEPSKKPKGNSAIAIALVAPRVVQTPFTNGGGGGGGAVGNNDKLKGSPKTVQFRNTATVNGKEKSMNIFQLRINDAKIESENNGLPVVPKTELGLLQHPHINHPIKEEPDEVKEFGDSWMFPTLIKSNEGGGQLPCAFIIPDYCFVILCMTLSFALFMFLALVIYHR